MVERVCPECQHGNPLDNRFCGRCGGSLERQLPAPGSAQTTAITLGGRSLPVTWKQVGQTVAVGVTALVAEAGMAWLRRKIEQVMLPAPPAARPSSTAIVPARNEPPATGNVVTIVSQRVVEVWEQGSLTRQVVERNFWRKGQ